MPQSKPDINEVWASTGDTGTPPLQADIQQGWTAEKPPFQEMNWLQKRFNEFIKHVNELGIAEWDANTEYQDNALVIHLGVHYTSNVGNNVGNDPTVNGWTQVDFQPAMPQGSIISWYGDYDNPPAGWAVCDGTNGTPDLRGRFIRAADSETGGSYPNQIASGADTANSALAGSHTHTTQNAGTHAHSVTVNPHTLTESQMPSHNHDIQGTLVTSSGDTEGSSGRYSSAGIDSTTILNKGGGGSHSHSASISGSGSHNHVVDSVGNHQHVVAMAPRQFTLVMLMKL